MGILVGKIVLTGGPCAGKTTVLSKNRRGTNGTRISCLCRW